MRLTTLQQFEHWWKMPVQFILLAFGFVNAGVPFSAVGPVTWIVLASLVVGKPIGIVATTLLAERAGVQRARRAWTIRSLVTLGVAAGIGFTVALFFTTAAFPPGAISDAGEDGRAVQLLRAA